MNSKTFWTRLFLRVIAYAYAVGTAILFSMAFFLAQYSALSVVYLFLACVPFGLSVAAVRVRAGLETDSRSSVIGAIVLSALGLPSILIFLAVPSLIQAIRLLSCLPEKKETPLPDCPVCQEPLLIKSQMGKTQLCGCGWFAPIQELHFMHQAPSQRGKNWVKFAVGPAAVFAVCVIGFAVAMTYYSPALKPTQVSAAEVPAPAALQKNAGVKAAEKSLDEWRRLGAQCNTNNDFKCSKRAYSAILQKDPRDVAALANLGFAEYHLGHHKDAVRLLKTVIDSGNPTYDTIAFYGMSLEALGDSEGALKAYLKTLQLYDRLVDIRQKAIAILIQKNRLDQASDLLKAYVYKYPEARGYFTAQEQLIRERKSEVSRQPEESAATTI